MIEMATAVARKPLRTRVGVRGRDGLLSNRVIFMPSAGYALRAA
jgi:hypothetical protein